MGAIKIRRPEVLARLARMIITKRDAEDARHEDDYFTGWNGDYDAGWLAPDGEYTGIDGDVGDNSHNALALWMLAMKAGIEDPDDYTRARGAIESLWVDERAEAERVWQAFTDANWETAQDQLWELGYIRVDINDVSGPDWPTREQVLTLAMVGSDGYRNDGCVDIPQEVAWYLEGCKGWIEPAKVKVAVDSQELGE